MHGRMVKKRLSPDRIMAVLGLAILAADCSAPLTTREKDALAGGAIGTGTGAVVASTANHTGTDAPIGAGAVSGALTGDAMQANEQKQGAPIQPPAESPAPPPPAPVEIGMSQPRTLHAREIKAGQVRANTIYANEIKARDVHGQVYQANEMETQGWYGKIDASVISASVIFARRIQANSVAAQTIYVHKLEIR